MKKHRVSYRLRITGRDEAVSIGANAGDAAREIACGKLPHLRNTGSYSSERRGT